MATTKKRRFGPAARAEINTHKRDALRMAAAYQMADGLARSQSETIQRLSQEIADAKRIVGENSALFPPNERLKVYGKQRKMVEVMGRPQLMPIPAGMSYDRKLDFSDTVASALKLNVLVGMFEETAWNEIVHFKVDFDDKQACLAMTKHAMKATPTNILIERVAENLARQLVYELKARVGR